MRLVPAAAVTPAELAAAKEIYAAAFPPALSAPFEDLLADEALVLMDEAPAGLAVLRPLDGTGWTFLRYIAIGARGRGLGSRMWPLLLEHCAAAGHDRLLLDVEDPDEPGTGEEERELRERRIGFYRRLGVSLLPVREYRPPHDGRPHPMRLLATTTGPGELPDDVRAMVVAVYRHRYRLADNDPIVVRTLAASGL